MSTTLHEGRWPAAYLVSDDIHLSREVITLAAGNVLEAGTVLGKVTASGKYTPLNPSANDGSQNAAAILYDNVDASASDVPAVVTIRQTAVKESELIWPASITEKQRQAAIDALAAQTIILR